MSCLWQIVPIGQLRISAHSDSRPGETETPPLCFHDPRWERQYSEVVDYSLVLVSLIVLWPEQDMSMHTSKKE